MQNDSSHISSIQRHIYTFSHILGNRALVGIKVDADEGDLLAGAEKFLEILLILYLRKSFGSTLFCAFAALMVYELLVFATGLFLGYTTSARFVAFCITGGLSGAVMPLMYPVFLSIGKIGGESWKE